MGSSFDDTKLIIAADANPRRAGGILKFQDSRGHRYLWYYSVNWDTHVNFSNDPSGQKPDRMELANALLAVYIAEDAFRLLPERCDTIVIKLDNDVAVNNRKHKEIVDEINRVRRSFRSLEFKKVTKSTDPDMFNADMLSRGEYHKFSAQERYPGYDVWTDKSGAARNCLTSVIHHLPLHNVRITTD